MCGREREGERSLPFKPCELVQGERKPALLPLACRRNKRILFLLIKAKTGSKTVRPLVVVAPYRGACQGQRVLG